MGAGGHSPGDPVVGLVGVLELLAEPDVGRAGAHVESGGGEGCRSGGHGEDDCGGELHLGLSG